MATALITGCSSGIGLSTAVLLAEAGYQVVATMRNLEKAAPLTERAEASGVTLDLRELDVASLDSIAACVDGVLRDHGSIDLLVNNAGFGALGSCEQLPTEALNRVMDTNFFGVWHATRAVLPSMRERGSGHIVTVTSIGGLIGQPFNDAYCAAKFAVEGMMESLAPVVRQFGIKLSVVEPGPVLTSFVETVRAQSSATLASDVPGYAELLEKYLSTTGGVFEQYGQSGDDIARLIVEIADSAEPHFRYVTSDYARAFAEQKYVDTSGDSIVELFAARLRDQPPAEDA